MKKTKCSVKRQRQTEKQMRKEAEEARQKLIHAEQEEERKTEKKSKITKIVLFVILALCFIGFTEMFYFTNEYNENKVMNQNAYELCLQTPVGNRTQIEGLATYTECHLNSKWDNVLNGKIESLFDSMIVSAMISLFLVLIYFIVMEWKDVWKTVLIIILAIVGVILWFMINYWLTK